MKILVIGGSRFFGKRLVERLLEAKHSVTLLNRGQASDGFGDRVERLRLDRKTLRAGHPALEGKNWDLVYDQVCYEAPEAEGALEAFRGRVGHYVFTSSQSVYGGGQALSENAFDPRKHAFTKAIDRNADYSEAKRQCESVFFRTPNFPVTAVRFPIVLGEDDYTGRLAFHVERIRDGKPIFFPKLDARISFIHAADAALFLSELAGRSPVGEINVCSPEPIRLADLIAQIESNVDRKAVLVSKAEQGETSPYGITDDWFMSADKLRRLEFTGARPISDWLPNLIKAL